MPGKLRFDDMDVMNPETVRKLVTALTDQAGRPKMTFWLEIRNRYYFEVHGGPLSTSPGWYVISDRIGPLYVGTASDLNSRLNSKNGSLDNFANSKRPSDLERNFIKAFKDLGLLEGLQVTVIEEPALCAAMGLTSALSARDRQNVEKILNLLRGRIMANPREYETGGR